MTEDIKNLYKKFCFIKDMGFIKSKRKGSTGVGYTFEELINKPEESFPIPDFNSIEIKTCRYQSRQAIHLFTATPDGDFLFPIKRIIDILGYPDKDIKTSKVFNFSFNGKSYSNIGYHKRGKIVVNWKDEKIDFIALDLVNNNLNVDVSWSFDLLQEKLNMKLKYLAIIDTDSKFINGEEYFHYCNIRFYKLKDFDTFISLIEKGYINVCFNIGVFKYGPKMGQIHDHGVGFTLSKKYIKMLYDEIKV